MKRGWILYRWIYLTLQVIEVISHGRLMDPPARNSMWRVGFANPVNYNDNELFCGGYAVQWQQNQGRCGPCGDAHHLNKPRPHEAGGEYGRGIITRHYTAGQDITIEVELTSNHQGHFELYICPNNNPRVPVTQECFDNYPLNISGTKQVKFIIPEDSDKKAIFRYRVTLPPYLTCSQCVMQWNYYTGNMWGICDDGTEGVQCGRPETFRNCADVSIVTSTGGVPPGFTHQQDNPFQNYYQQNYYSQDYHSQNQIGLSIIRSQVCVPEGMYRAIPGMKAWCQNNCVRLQPFCPEEICICPQRCTAMGRLKGQRGADEYCMDQCLVYPSKCPPYDCHCY